jgi:hypothetical protein
MGRPQAVLSVLGLSVSPRDGKTFLGWPQAEEVSVGTGRRDPRDPNSRWFARLVSLTI